MQAKIRSQFIVFKKFGSKTKKFCFPRVPVCTQWTFFICMKFVPKKKCEKSHIIINCKLFLLCLCFSEWIFFPNSVVLPFQCNVVCTFMKVMVIENEPTTVVPHFPRSGSTWNFRELIRGGMNPIVGCLLFDHPAHNFLRIFHIWLHVRCSNFKQKSTKKKSLQKLFDAKKMNDDYKRWKRPRFAKLSTPSVCNWRCMNR
jgi:hypothetical protein